MVTIYQEVGEEGGGWTGKVDNPLLSRETKLVWIPRGQGRGLPREIGEVGEAQGWGEGRASKERDPGGGSRGGGEAGVEGISRRL